MNNFRPSSPLKWVTATSLFDGHDAAIHIIRRLIQNHGGHVVHLGHNISVAEVVRAAIDEGADCVCISSYQGGHIEYFSYLIDELRKNGSRSLVFGGGGGTIAPEEVEKLHAYGVEKIYTPEDGQKLGLIGMIEDMFQRAQAKKAMVEDDFLKKLLKLTTKEDIISFCSSKLHLAKILHLFEYAPLFFSTHEQFFHLFEKEFKMCAENISVVCFSGTGGAGKSSLIDEVLARFLNDSRNDRQKEPIAIVALDPERKKTKGALLGDRLRMTQVGEERGMRRVFMHSFATTDISTKPISPSVSHDSANKGGLLKEPMHPWHFLPPALTLLSHLGYRWIFVETPGLGQEHVLTQDVFFGKKNETNKVSCIQVYVMTSDYGAQSQLEKINILDEAHIVCMNKSERMGSIEGAREVRKHLRRIHHQWAQKDLELMPVIQTSASTFGDPGVDFLYEQIQRALSKAPERICLDRPQDIISYRPLISHKRSSYLGDIADSITAYHQKTKKMAMDFKLLESFKDVSSYIEDKNTDETVKKIYDSLLVSMAEDIEWMGNEKKKLDAIRANDDFSTTTLSKNTIRTVVVPDFLSSSEWVTYLRAENAPGSFPFTSGLFLSKKEGEDPKRQFAGESTPQRTNKRFHYLSQFDTAKRLSTAFDSVTLYGEDPSLRPDIFGKIGESGVSIASVNDMELLFHGFRLAEPHVSVSMTINGPSPILLSFFFLAAFRQEYAVFEMNHGHKPSMEEKENINDQVLKHIRGTVQADILKEDQAQNTCIFSIPFSLKLMSDVQKYFIKKEIKNYYSVSISGYHIAEAGANPITQLAFTLANGFTYVEYYLEQGMNINDFVKNFSFFFSTSMDIEYSVLGRVARRIWAIALRDYYQADLRSQKLKYHIQTSGRSLHAQEITFNDIRTTLQALLAYLDQCNSLHTNAYDEALTIPTETSVRQALAIQLIVMKEFGLSKCINSLQGSYCVSALTDMVEQAVLEEFRALDVRGGVLKAMENYYQRSKIQDESMYYEEKKHSGKLPIIGVNTFTNLSSSPQTTRIFSELQRATYEEKMEQIRHLNAFHKAHEQEKNEALDRLKNACQHKTNLFEAILSSSEHLSLGEITSLLYAYGGKYRKTM